MQEIGGDIDPVALYVDLLPKQCPVCGEKHDRRDELCWVCNRLRTSARKESEGYMGASEYDA